MLAAFFITLRETLEASLIVGIILSYLKRTEQTKYNNTVYYGVVAGVAASLLGAVLFNALAGGFEGQAEEIFEGVTMLIGAGLLTWMILWMMKQRNAAGVLEQKVEKKVVSANKFDLFALVFVAILREGIETVIFLNAAFFASTGSRAPLGAVLGIIVAIFIGYLLFVEAKRLKLKTFFTATSIILILFAAGLTAHGVHELQEAGWIPTVIEEVWDINPSFTANGGAVSINGEIVPHYGVYPLLHEKGIIGGMFKGLFGYNGNPSLIEVISYVAYLIFAGLMWKKMTTIKK